MWYPEEIQMGSRGNKLWSIHLRTISKVHSRALGNNLLAMLLTVCKLVANPSFKRMVTGPEASAQVMLTVEPATMGLAKKEALIVN